MVALVKQDGIRRKDRPMIEGVSWLVKTQYISPVSMEVAKKVGRSILQWNVIGFYLSLWNLIFRAQCEIQIAVSYSKTSKRDA